MSEGSHTNRKLAAILFADIQGYTSMMQKAEAQALKTVTRFETILKENVEKHLGKIIKSYGDGCLVLFDSAVASVHCARDMQIEFKKDPIVPLRIGLHLGEVIHKNQDVFGNDINIASRIETMGIPGAVLLSKNMYEAIQNQTTLPTKRLGTFQLKNVSEKMEVYALDIKELIIPDRDDLPKRFKNRSPRRNFFLTFFLVVVVVLALIVGRQIRTSKLQDAPLSQESNEKRLAVMNFENQTQNTDLDVFGNMISDWLTKGLMESGEANIARMSNFQKEIGSTDLKNVTNPGLSELTGIDIIISGRYYKAETQLIVVADIIDIFSGKVLNTIQVASPQNETMSLLDLLTSKVISYWAVKDKIQLIKNPPMFEAYKLYLKGNELYSTDAREAKRYYQQAYNIDTTFLEPLFRISTILLNMGNVEESEEIINFLESKKDKFNSFQRIEYDFRIASRVHNYYQAAVINDEKIRMDPGDAKTNYNSAYLYALANYPAKTLEVLENYSKELRDNAESKNWRTALLCYALKKLGHCDKVVDEARKTDFSKFPVILAVMELQCLIELDSLESMVDRLDHYKNIGVYNPIGIDANLELFFIVCNELFIEAHSDYLGEVAKKLKNLIDPNSLDAIDNSSPDLFNNRPFKTYEALGYIDFYNENLQKAIDSWTKEDIPNSNWPDQLDQFSRLGYTYALLQDSIKAQDFLSKIDKMDIENPYFKLNQLYFRARILAGLGHIPEAVESIENSFESGMMTFRPFVMDDDPFLIPVHKHPSFLSLITPKE